MCGYTCTVYMYVDSGDGYIDMSYGRNCEIASFVFNCNASWAVVLS